MGTNCGLCLPHQHAHVANNTFTLSVGPSESLSVFCTTHVGGPSAETCVLDRYTDLLYTILLTCAFQGLSMSDPLSHVIKHVLFVALSGYQFEISEVVVVRGHGWGHRRGHPSRNRDWRGPPCHHLRGRGTHLTGSTKNDDTGLTADN
jgi:hypothetical protein